MNEPAPEPLEIVAPAGRRIDLAAVKTALERMVAGGPVKAAFHAKGMNPFVVRIAGGDLATVRKLLRNAATSRARIERVVAAMASKATRGNPFPEPSHFVDRAGLDAVMEQFEGRRRGEDFEIPAHVAARLARSHGNELPQGDEWLPVELGRLYRGTLVRSDDGQRWILKHVRFTGTKTEARHFEASGLVGTIARAFTRRVRAAMDPKMFERMVRLDDPDAPNDIDEWTGQDTNELLRAAFREATGRPLYLGANTARRMADLGLAGDALQLARREKFFSGVARIRAELRAERPARSTAKAARRGARPNPAQHPSGKAAIGYLAPGAEGRMPFNRNQAFRNDTGAPLPYVDSMGTGVPGELAITMATGEHVIVETGKGNLLGTDSVEGPRPRARTSYPFGEE